MSDFNEMADEAKRNKALDELAKFGQEQEKARIEYEKDVDFWWGTLSEREREDAFYAVIKRMHKAELVDRGTYRYALYEVFGFDPGMYMRGMDCGYMALHNAIHDGEELAAMKNVNRFEVINSEGRSYVKYLNKDERVKFSLQDDDRTLKVFIDSNSWKDEL